VLERKNGNRHDVGNCTWKEKHREMALGNGGIKGTEITGSVGTCMETQHDNGKQGKKGVDL